MKDIDEIAEMLIQAGLPYVAINGRITKEKITGADVEYELDWEDEKGDYHIRMFKNWQDLQTWVKKLKGGMKDAK